MMEINYKNLPKDDRRTPAAMAVPITPATLGHGMQQQKIAVILLLADGLETLTQSGTTETPAALSSRLIFSLRKLL